MVPSESQSLSAKWVRGENSALALEHSCSSRELSEPGDTHTGKQTAACPVRAWTHMLAVSTHNPHLNFCYLHMTDEETKAEHWLLQPCLERLSAIASRDQKKTDQGEVKPKKTEREEPELECWLGPKTAGESGGHSSPNAAAPTPLILPWGLSL